MKIRNVIKNATLSLKKNYISNANLDAEILLSEAIQTPRKEIILNSENYLNSDQIINYKKLINRRKKNEPVSIILGKKFFWKSEFIVNRNVLTPRFETELLVEEILKITKYNHRFNILDIGLGSGCIIISLLKEKNWVGTGIDKSIVALNTAKTNAKIQHVENRIKFVKSDIDKVCSGKYDLIVSNPPYINKINYNNLDLGVKDYEPKMALYGGIDGLRTIEKVINKSKFLLKYFGILAIEIGLGQHYEVSKMLNEKGFFIFKTLKDYQKIKRFIFARKIK